MTIEQRPQAFATLSLAVINQPTWVDEEVTINYIQKRATPEAGNYVFLLEKETAQGNKYFDILESGVDELGTADYRLVNDDLVEDDHRTTLKFRRRPDLEGNLLVIRTTQLFQTYKDGDENVLERQLDNLTLFSREMQAELTKTIKFADSTGLFAEAMKTLVPRIETVVGFTPVARRDEDGNIVLDNNNDPIMDPKLELLHWHDVGEDPLEAIANTVADWALQANPTVNLPPDKIGDGTITKDKLDTPVVDTLDDAVAIGSIELDDDDTGRELQFASGRGTVANINTPGITVEDEGTILNNANRVTELNFKGGGVTATAPVGEPTKVDIDVPDPGVTVLDETTNLGRATQIEFTGAGVVASVPDPADPGRMVVSVTDQGSNNTTVGVTVEDEGTQLGTEDTVDTLNFTGAGVTATRTGTEVEVAVPGGGSGGVEVQDEDTQQ